MKNISKLLFSLLPISIIVASLTACSLFRIDKIISNKEYYYSENGVSDVYSDLSDNENKYTPRITYQDLKDNCAYDIDNTPSEGDVNILVIPTWFKDSYSYIDQVYKESVRQDIYFAFFGDEKDTGWRSVSGYYKQESFNKLNLKGTVTSWWECNKTSSEINDTTKTKQLVESAVNWYKANNKDIGAYDSDKDGYIDGVVLIYAAPDHSHSSITNDNSWAYTFWMQKNNPNILSPNPNAFLWASYDFMYDKDITRYGKKYGYGDNRFCSIDAHTYIHEFGHMLGLEDYYDYAGDEGYTAAGGFSMQDYNVGAHDPFSKLALGWIKPYVVTDECEITINPIEISGDVILLGNNYNGSCFDEYLLLELYTSTGLNKFDSAYPYCHQIKLKGPILSGVRLWHVDARIASPTGKTNGKYTWSEYTVTTDPTIPNRYGYYQVTTNTTKTSKTTGHYSEIASFTNYRMLQLIRKNKNNYKCDEFLNFSHLFTSGTSFDMNTYSDAFVNKGKLNNGKNIDYKITFKDVSSDGATISFEKI